MKYHVFSAFALAFAVYACPALAARTLPKGMEPVPVQSTATMEKAIAETTMTITLTFWNTGSLFDSQHGKATLLTYCDQSKLKPHQKCIGVNTEGTFSGGPDGTAKFDVDGKKLIFNLHDGKYFAVADSSDWKLEVKDHSIFRSWTEGGRELNGALISEISGQVEVACLPNLEQWAVARIGAVAIENCHIKTGENGFAVLSLSNMASFTLRPESEAVLKNSSMKDSNLKLLAGAILVNMKATVKGGTVEMEMSQATASTKEATFATTESGTASELKVIEGEVFFQSKNKDDLQTITAGKTITASAEGLAPAVNFDVDKEKKDWEQIAQNLKNEKKSDNQGVDRGIQNEKNTQISTDNEKSKSKDNQMKVLIAIGGVLLLALASIFFFLIKKKFRKKK